mmetsp:Transcript_6644/g.13081  ORF Transcript_6644/g.13081 Transcript_6644/m.13081 type:complete len:382 (-) Transcript_6644:132-1277(-)
MATASKSTSQRRHPARMPPPTRSPAASEDESVSCCFSFRRLFSMPRWREADVPATQRSAAGAAAIGGAGGRYGGGRGLHRVSDSRTGLASAHATRTTSSPVASSRGGTTLHSRSQSGVEMALHRVLYGNRVSSESAAVAEIHMQVSRRDRSRTPRSRGRTPTRSAPISRNVSRTVSMHKTLSIDAKSDRGAESKQMTTRPNREEDASGTNTVASSEIADRANLYISDLEDEADHTAISRSNSFATSFSNVSSPTTDAITPWSTSSRLGSTKSSLSRSGMLSSNRRSRRRASNNWRSTNIPKVEEEQAAECEGEQSFVKGTFSLDCHVNSCGTSRDVSPVALVRERRHRDQEVESLHPLDSSRALTKRVRPVFRLADDAGAA